jgi:hypothetical protein
MPFLDRLKRSVGSDFDPAAVQAFTSALEGLAEQGARHFSAGAFTRDANLDRTLSLRLLMHASAAGIVEPIYEVECPRCGIRVAEFRDTSFRDQWLECSNPGCEHTFRPDDSVIRVLFDFTPEYSRPVSSLRG